MSAWIVSRQHVDVMVDAAIRSGLIEPSQADEVGRMLWKENLVSVAYRYPRDKDGKRPGPTDFRDADVETYTFTPVPKEIVDVWKLNPDAALAKTVSCYEYQSCEHPGWRDSPACALSSRLRELVREHDGYDDRIPWGWEVPLECQPKVDQAALRVEDMKIESFIERARTSVAYDEDAKREFHRQGEAVLKQLAVALGYGPDHYDLRHNQGGSAVSGEITLHCDRLYVQFSQSPLAQNRGFLWRTCEGRKDYTGGLNRSAKWEELRDLPRLARTMHEALEMEQLSAWAENYRRLNRLLDAGSPVQVQGHAPLTVVKLHEECWRVQLGDPAAPDHAYTFGIWPASPEASPKARPHYYEGKRPEEVIDIWGDSPVDMPQADPAVEDQLGKKLAVFWAELEERGYFHLADHLARQQEAKTLAGPAAASGESSQQEGVTHLSEATTEPTCEPGIDCRANEPYQVIDTRGIYQLVARGRGDNRSFALLENGKVLCTEKDGDHFYERVGMVSAGWELSLATGALQPEHEAKATSVSVSENPSYSEITNDRAGEKPETPGLKPPSGNERNDEMAEYQNEKNGQSTKRQESGKNKPLHRETHGAVQVTIWDNGPDREPTVNFGRFYRSSGGWKVAQSFQAKHLSDLMKATEAAALVLGQELERRPQSLSNGKPEEVCSIDSGRFAAVFSDRSNETTGTHTYAAKILCDGKEVFAPMLNTELVGLQAIAQAKGLPWLTDQVAKEHLPEPTTNDLQHFKKTLEASQALMGRFMESGHKKVLADKEAVQELGLDVSGVPEQEHETTHDRSR